MTDPRTESGQHPQWAANTALTLAIVATFLILVAGVVGNSFGVKAGMVFTHCRNALATLAIAFGVGDLILFPRNCYREKSIIAIGSVLLVSLVMAFVTLGMALRRIG